MAVSISSTGRLPNITVANRLNEQIQAGRIAIQQLQDQMTTGQKFQTPGENPAAALATMILQKQLERNAQFQTNAQTGQTLLSSAQTALSTINDSLNQAAGAVLQGIGDTVTPTERQGLADTVASLLQHVVQTANTKSGARYLFSGSNSTAPPFELLGNGQVRYNGDTGQFSSLVNNGIFVPTNLDGVSVFNALATVNGSDLNPALTLQTALSSLNGGEGIGAGGLQITVDDGSGPITKKVDLSEARTLNDVKNSIEGAFASESVTLTVDVDSLSLNGLLVTPSSGTVSISNIAGSRTASDLGLVASGATEINGSDLNPQLTLLTNLSDLNLGTGIGDVSGTGLFIVNGDKSGTVDLSGATTVEDLFNALKLSGLDVAGEINSAGDGLSISSRLSGAGFSIGENNSNNAALLGIRSFSGQTLLSSLNDGQGVDRSAGSTFDITRRDGSVSTVDLTSAGSIQEVLDAINAVDPGNLVASLSTTGNGISITDSSGTDPLTVSETPLTRSLGINGTESGSDASVALQGSDVSQIKSHGLLGLFGALETALRAGDNKTLTRLQGQFQDESSRFITLQGQLGNRIKTLDSITNQLQDENVQLNDSLSNVFDADLTEVVSGLVNRQQTLEATYKAASQTFQLSLLNFL